MNGIDQSLIARQIALEEESVVLGATNYKRQLAKAETHTTIPGRQLLKTATAKVAEAIELFVAEANSGKAGRKHASVKWVSLLDSGALAYLTTMQCLNALGTPKRARAQAVALSIATGLENDINYEKFRKEHPGLYVTLQRVLQKSTSKRHSEGVMDAALRRKEVETFAFPETDGLSLGLKMVELFIEVTGFGELYLDQSRGIERRELVLRPLPALTDWLNDANERMALLSPMRMPMLVPPNPWGESGHGGYLTGAGGRESFVRTRNRAYLRELRNVEMPEVYDAVNAIQATGWAINKPVLEVMETLWAMGGGIAGLPGADHKPIPAKPAGLIEHGDAFKEMEPEAFKKWKREAAETREENARAISSRKATYDLIDLARRFADEEAIYFPHSLDFRGRIYPIPVRLTPQGDDATKALLQFAEGVPLGEGGAFWLAVHVANCFGVDKLSFDDRVQWVMENEELILDSAIDPLDGQRFWMRDGGDPSKDGDSPFSALAACFEWAGYKLCGDEHVSRIPIALDGSCNGLQNFSAMLRDPIGGSATNLIPQAKPADIYTEVKNLAQKYVRAAAEAGDPIAMRWDGRLTRALAKQPVMTLPYGVTKQGIRGQLAKAMEKMGVKDKEGAAYLAAVFWDCIGEVVVAARQAMDWLRDAAKVASAGDHPLSWTTAAGFPVLQEYKEEMGRRIKLHVGGRKVQLGLNSDTDKLDRRRQALGISPNFVHSQDASHLMLTVNVGRHNGITHFAMIHDSYGTHAGRCDTLAASLRQAFVNQYSGDVLGDFKRELEAQLPPEIAAELPPLPPMGTLDLQLVLSSEYFFA